MLTSLMTGIRTALRTPTLVALLWFWTLLLAGAAALPARSVFGRALDLATETTALLTRFSTGAFADVVKYNDISPIGLLIPMLLGVGLLALLGSAFVNGGVIEVLTSSADGRTFMHRFFRGGGHFFWRFVRLALLAFALGGFATGIVATGVGAMTSPLGDSEWEPAGAFWGLVTAAVSGLVALWFVLALDYARIRVVRDGNRSMLRAYLAALVFVVRHVWATYGLVLVYLLVSAGLLLAYVGHEAVWTHASWGAIFVLLATQQVLMLLRTGARVALVAAERAYFVRMAPVAPAAMPAEAAVVTASTPMVAEAASNPEPPANPEQPA